MARLRALLARPIVHFLAIGGALFAAQGGLGRGSAGGATPPVAIAPERVAELRRDFAARSGAAPDEATLRALVDDALDDEVLLHEARARGLHRLDSVVRQRLVQNMRFLEPDSSRSDEELFQEALDLGMDESDLVVRRRLVQMMRLAAFASARLPEPDEAALRDALARHAERYRQPERVRLSQVYLSRDARGASLEADARALLARIRAAGRGPEAAASGGDPFLLPRELPLRSQRELARSFGPAFAAAVMELAPGAWAGPVESAYGMHLVFVHERQPAAMPPLDTVRSSLREAVFEERGRAAERELLRALRARYGVPRREASG